MKDLSNLRRYAQAVVSCGVALAVAWLLDAPVSCSSLRFPDGSIKRIRIVGHPWTDAAGNVVQLIGSTIDVTEQQQARAALEGTLGEVQKSEGRLRRIINTIPTLVWSARPDGSADYFNERWLAYTGLAPEEVLDWNFDPRSSRSSLNAYRRGVAGSRSRVWLRPL
jgi:PAS domain-containing protein